MWTELNCLKARLGMSYALKVMPWGSSQSICRVTTHFPVLTRGTAYWVSSLEKLWSHADRPSWGLVPCFWGSQGVLSCLCQYEIVLSFSITQTLLWQCHLLPSQFKVNPMYRLVSEAIDYVDTQTIRCWYFRLTLNREGPRWWGDVEFLVDLKTAFAGCVEDIRAMLDMRVP